MVGSVEDRLAPYILRPANNILGVHLMRVEWAGVGLLGCIYIVDRSMRW